MIYYSLVNYNFYIIHIIAYICNVYILPKKIIFKFLKCLNNLLNYLN